MESSAEKIFAKGGSLAIGLLSLRGLFVRYNFLPTTIAFYPSMAAVGFSAGKRIPLPFCLGFALKYKILPVLGVHLGHINATSNPEAFIFAVSSGIVIFDLLATLLLHIQRYAKQAIYATNTTVSFPKWNSIKHTPVIYIFLFGFMLFLLGHWIGLPYAASLFITTTSVPILFEVMKVAASLGLVPFGRFATILMVPALLLFTPTYFVLVLLCFFISVAAAAAVSYMFNQKTAALLKIPEQTVKREFGLAIILTSCLATLVFFFLFSKMLPGTTDLFALRGQNRAMLIKGFSLSPQPLLIGGVILIFTKLFAIPETMVFSAMLMPLKLSLSMLAGSLLNFVTKKNSNSEFFFSGIFAGESIFIIGSLFFQ